LPAKGIKREKTDELYACNDAKSGHISFFCTFRGPMISIVLGTRPEIIKMSPLIRACSDQGLDYEVFHTGQHYSYAMDRIFFEQLDLPLPAHNLDAGSGTHGAQTAEILTGLEKSFLKNPPGIVLVQGDTNTVLAGALAASKLHIPVGHVEAGLRSFDRSMPEEINRIVADHVSNHLYAPTEISRQNLLREGINAEKITVTGNTVVDALQENLRIAHQKVHPLEDLGLEPSGYFLVTAHRAENVDDPVRLSHIMDGLRKTSEHFGLPVVFPMHPRTRKMVHEFSLSTEGIRVMDPVGYLEFLVLESKAMLILTDSGGVQEEGCILSVPCVTLRDNTERPETIDAGANVLAGTNPEKILTSVLRIIDIPRTWKNPFGNGNAARCILEVCKKHGTL
jgi:UDP-N-acetylglucosamine 2-epimerase (non-hydrolysing)